MRNETIDFLLFTDDSISSEGNIRVEHMSWEGFVKHIQSFFSFTIALKSPYKICDFRPAFGELFSDYIKDYDFWGYADIDLLFGDLRTFLTDEVLNCHDRCFFNGHISLYRNCDKMNRLWRYQEGGYPAVNYQECYSSPRAFYFDEFGAMYAKCLINDVKVYDDLELRRDPIIGLRKFFWKDQAPSSQFLVCWEEGKLYAIQDKKKIEIIYAHFFRRRFTIAPKPETVHSIVIAPGEVRYNTEAKAQDMEKTESRYYRQIYFWNALKGTIKHNGIMGTIEKRRRDRDYWGYRRKLEYEHSDPQK